MNATVCAPIVESVLELSVFMKIICLKHRRYDGTIAIMQIPLTRGMQEARVAIPKSGLLLNYTMLILTKTNKRYVEAKNYGNDTESNWNLETVKFRNVLAQILVHFQRQHFFYSPVLVNQF